MHNKLINELQKRQIITKSKGFDITPDLIVECSKVYLELSNTKAKKVSLGDLRYNVKLLCLSLIKFKQENKLPIKEGFIYFIANKAWPNYFKIGMSANPKKRLASYQTYSPFRDYTMLHWSFWFDRKEGEKFVHSLYQDRDHEWVKLPQRKLNKIFEQINKLSGLEHLVQKVNKEIVNAPIV